MPNVSGITEAGAIVLLLGAIGFLIFKTMSGIRWSFSEYFSLVIILAIIGFIIYFGIKQTRKQTKSTSNQ